MFDVEVGSMDVVWSPELYVPAVGVKANKSKMYKFVSLAVVTVMLIVCWPSASFGVAK